MLRLVLLSLFFLGACTHIEVPPEFTYTEVQTSGFKIAAWKKITRADAPMKVYIEGDGYAFRGSGAVSSNPTPHGILLRQIAFGDSHENVIYLARPCQFVQDDKCSPKDWSDARFSKMAVQSEYEAVKHFTGNSSLTLVGFSGGAQIAGLMVVKHPDLAVHKLVTIAGNLDVAGWVEYHQLSPLKLSDDLHDWKDKYAAFNQVHYVGTDDTNIVPQITEQFVADKNTIKYVRGASHNQGWEKAFKAIRAE